jgi:acyl-CoA synthetase (AMP-forming)/AMP-acid ligase II
MIESALLPKHQIPKFESSLPYSNINELFIEKYNRNKDKVFVICPGKQNQVYTYSQFRENYLKASEYMISLGYVKGDRISIVFSNSIEFLLLYFAGLKIGITLVPINPDLSGKEIRYIVENSQSRAVFYDISLEYKISALSDSIPVDIHVFKLSPIPKFEPILIEENSTHFKPPEDVGLADEAVIIYTSGTSGNPKGVILSQLNLLADAKSIAGVFRFSEETRAMCILPLFHNNGQITTLLAPLFGGGSTVIIKGKASLLSFWGIAEEYNVTWTSVMASILSILLSLKTERSDNSLNGILCGGQVLTNAVQNEFEDRFGVPIFEGYGLTETTSFSCINNFPASERRSGSIGKPLPTNDMAILDENGNLVGDTIEGEICIRGYNVACEYLGLDEANKKSFRGGWFHSGDYGYRDNDGYFYFNGRKDSLIIKGGENIYPAELENIIFKHPAVAEVAVIGIPVPLLGEDLCAFVKLHENENISELDLKTHCRGKIATYKQPRQIIIINERPDIEEIPKGPTKKILYRILQKYYADMK